MAGSNWAILWVAPQWCCHSTDIRFDRPLGTFLHHQARPGSTLAARCLRMPSSPHAILAVVYRRRLFKLLPDQRKGIVQRPVHRLGAEQELISIFYLRPLWAGIHRCAGCAPPRSPPARRAAVAHFHPRFSNNRLSTSPDASVNSVMHRHAHRPGRIFTTVWKCASTEYNRYGTAIPMNQATQH